jgi:Spy/CpxP family protein refolding chaperone
MSMKKSMLLSVSLLFVFSFTVVVAQEEGTPSSSPMPADERVVIEAKDRKESPASKGLKLEREVRPRLPNGFAPIVDTAQRESIHNIQREYNELIAFLRLRIELLEKERDAKIDDVLTPNQLERLNRPARRLLRDNPLRAN